MASSPCGTRVLSPCGTFVCFGVGHVNGVQKIRDQLLRPLKRSKLRATNIDLKWSVGFLVRAPHATLSSQSYFRPSSSGLCDRPEILAVRSDDAFGDAKSVVILDSHEKSK